MLLLHIFDDVVGAIDRDEEDVDEEEMTAGIQALRDSAPIAEDAAPAEMEASGEEGHESNHVIQAHLKQQQPSETQRLQGKVAEAQEQLTQHKRACPGLGSLVVQEMRHQLRGRKRRKPIHQRQQMKICLKQN